MIAAQAFLWGQGKYSYAVDNVWGSRSDMALKSYQSSHGLTADGCAGPLTWENMQKQLKDYGSGSNPRYISTVTGRYAWFNYSHANNDTSSSCRWSTDTQTPPSNYTRGGPVASGSYNFQFNLVGISPFPNC